MITPLIVGGGLFVFTLGVFVAVYSFFEYGSYLSAYQTTQRLEHQAVQQKTEATFKKLEELLQLTSSRIGFSQDNFQQIQNILISAPRLYTSQELPSVQSLNYYERAKPYRVVSRLGISSLEQVQPLTLPAPPKTAEMIIQKDIIISKFPVFDENKALKGILEIQLSLSEFKAFLGDLRTLSLSPLSSAKEPNSGPLQKKPFAIYPKSPDSFEKFVFDRKNHYGIFFCFSLIAFFVLLCSLFYFYVYFQKAYGKKIETLEGDLLKAGHAEKGRNENLLEMQEKYKSCWTSLQSYKRMYANLNRRKREDAKQLYESLNMIAQAFKTPKAQRSAEQYFTFIQSCIKLAELLSKGIITSLRREKVSFTSLLEEVPSLFADKMYKSKIKIEMTCLEDLWFYGDPLFTELILMNVIGKAIHRTPKNGKILVTVTGQEDAIHFELRDKGFSLIDDTESLFKQSFDLFMPNDLVKKMCHKNGLRYHSVKDGEDFNVTTICISTYPVEDSEDNIIRLFK